MNLKFLFFLIVISPSCLAMQKIIHGTNAKATNFMVKLEVEFPNGQVQHCGGYLISETQLVTAAHCITNVGEIISPVAIDKISVYHGSNSQSVMHSKPEYKYKVESIQIHPHYKHIKYSPNDIAIITVNRKFENATQAPINTIANKHSFNERQLKTPRKLTISNALINADVVGLGWGLNEDMYDLSDLLQSNFMSALNAKDCHNSLMTDNQYFCTQGIGSEYHLQTDTCIGDSGSPILYQDEAGTVEVVGIVSYGSRNCDTSISVYTNVHFQYTDFIQYYLIGNPLPIANLNKYFEGKPTFYNEDADRTFSESAVIAYSAAWNTVTGILQYEDENNFIHTQTTNLWWYGYTGFYIPKNTKNIFFRLNGSRNGFYNKQYSPAQISLKKRGVSAYGIATNNWYKEDFQP